MGNASSVLLGNYQKHCVNQYWRQSKTCTEPKQICKAPLGRENLKFCMQPKLQQNNMHNMPAAMLPALIDVSNLHSPTRRTWSATCASRRRPWTGRGGGPGESRIINQLLCFSSQPEGTSRQILVIL